MSVFGDTILPVRPAAEAATAQALNQIAQPGSWWSGEERTAIARIARDALRGALVPADDLSPVVVEAADSVAVAASEITPDWLADLRERGLGPLAMVELIGLVSRISAIDTFARAVGSPLPPLAHPRPGAPTGEQEPAAAVTTGWLPTKGPAGAPNALSAVPTEHEAMHDLHGGYYLTLAQMADRQISIDGFGRAQMELAAARTSYLNDCFY